MSTKKEYRLGETNVNKQGFTMKIVKYLNNKCVTIEFMETGERREVSYMQFVKGTPVPDLYKYPPKGECTIKQGLVLLIGIVLLTLALIGGSIYYFCI